MILKFKKKISYMGNSHVIIIPSDFIKHGQLKLNSVYNFEVDTHPCSEMSSAPP